MSRERLVRNAIDAVNERDLDRYLACCTEDVELHTPLREVAGAYRGADGIRRFFEDVDDAGPDFQLELERVEVVGERALAFLHVRVTGRSSGIPMDRETANVYEFEGDLIRRVRIFAGHGEARAVELAQRAVDALNQPDAEMAAQLFGPDAEVDWSRSRGPLRGVYRGPDGVRTLMAEFRETFDSTDTEAEDFIVAGRDVLVPVTARMRGRDGMEVVARSAFVYTVDDGRITRMRMFQSLDEARAEI